MALRASIDIGTNTALLLVAEVKDGLLRVIEHAQRIPRLGKDVDVTRNIRNDRIEQLIIDLADFREIAHRHDVDPEQVVVTATSAMRDAENREQIIDRVRSETGFQIRLLSGEEEARMTWRGALLGMNASDEILVIDVGGGSTELAVGMANGGPEWSVSLDMGSVRATERYLKSPIPTVGEVKALQKELQRLLIDAKIPTGKNVSAIAVAGTATTAAAMLLNPDPSHYADLHGVAVTQRELGRLIQAVTGMGAPQRLQTWPQWLEGRADIIPAGLIILESILEWFGLGEFRVSLGGIRYGALLEE